MNKIALAIALVLLSFNSIAKKVKFAVDMDTFAISPNGIHVTGDFQSLAGYPGGDWTSNETVCTQNGTSTIYSVVVEIPAFSKYEYKFVNGDQFYEVEFVPIESRVGYDFNDNRWIWVDSLANDTTFVGAIKFAGNAPAGLSLVRFLIDLNNQTNISLLPHVAGNFQNWNPATTSLYSFGDSVFEIIRYVNLGTYQFKFINGNAWGMDESVPSACNVNGNRAVTVSKDTVLDSFCFASCTVCNPAAIREDLAKDEVSIYPNPTSEFTVISFRNHQTVKTVELIDLSGRVLRTYETIGGLKISKNDLEAGIYFVSIVDNSGTINTQKLLIQ